MYDLVSLKTRLLFGHVHEPVPVVCEAKNFCCRCTHTLTGVYDSEKDRVAVPTTCGAILTVNNAKGKEHK